MRIAQAPGSQNVPGGCSPLPAWQVIEKVSLFWDICLNWGFSTSKTFHGGKISALRFPYFLSSSIPEQREQTEQASKSAGFPVPGVPCSGHLVPGAQALRPPFGNLKVDAGFLGRSRLVPAIRLGMTAPLSRYTMTLPPDLIARVDALAEAEERSRSAVVRRVLRDALAEQTDQQAADRPAAAFLSAGSGK